MITCPKCSKDNQDHYKFCLGCGAELPRDAAPKPFTPQTPPHGMRAPSASQIPRAGSGAPAGTAGYAPVQVPQAAPIPAAVAHAPAPIPAAPAPAPAAGGSVAPGGATVICPQCGHVNGPGNLFCGSCGFRLGGAQAARPAAPPAEAPVEGVVLTALRADGSEAGTFALTSAQQTVGRETGAIFGSDSYLSPRHATFRLANGKLFIRDESSLNGVYKKVARDVPTEVRPNDVFRIGQEIIRFEALAAPPVSPDGVERLGSPSKGYVGRLSLVTGRDTSGNAFPVPDAGVHLGRERGDILFPEDGYVSGLHCRLSWEGGRMMLTDLGSSNGTFVRLYEETEVHSGDVLLMGQQLFRIAM